MAKLQFKFYNQAQGELFPSFLGDKIPETHHVRLLSGIIDALDITDLMSTYKSFGMTSVLIGASSVNQLKENIGL